MISLRLAAYFEVIGHKMCPLSETTISGNPNLAKTVDRLFSIVKVVLSSVENVSIQPVSVSTTTNLLLCTDPQPVH